MQINERPAFTCWIHPQKTLSLEIPEHWQARCQSGDPQHLSLQFHAPDTPEIGLRVAGIAHNLPADLPQQTGMALQFLKQSLTSVIPGWNLPPLTDSEIHPSTALQYPCCTFRLRDGSQWWACCSQSMLLLLSPHYPAEQQHEYGPVFNRMLGSLRIADSRAGQLAVLQAEVLRQFRRAYPTAGCRMLGDRLQLGSLHIFVDNLLSLVQSQPQKRLRLIRNFVRTSMQVSREADSLGREKWSSVQPLVYPMIRPAGFVNAGVVAGQAFTEPSAVDTSRQLLVAAPWLADLVICYAIDAPNTLRFVLNSDLDRWNIDQASLHRQALFNLRQIEGPSLMGQPSIDGILRFAVPGDSAIPVKSAWLLHPLLFRNIQAYLRGPIWAAVPNRDTLLLFSAGDLDRTRVLNAVRRDYCSSQHPISDRIFQITADGIALA